MALQPLFRLGSLSASQRGVRSLLAFWMGGATFAGAEEQPSPQQPAPQPQPQPQPAGGIPRGTYTPPRRKPERLVFLEREILECRERLQQLERQQREQQTRQAKEEAERDVRAVAELEQVRQGALFELTARTELLKREIDRLEGERTAEFMRLDDEDAIIAIIAATLH